MTDAEQEILDEERFGALIRSHPEHCDLVERIHGAIDEGFGDPDFKMADVAAAVGLSERRVRQILRDDPDQPTYLRAELDERRMKRARRLLRDTNWAIEMIGFQCGYRSASSFTRRFSSYHDGTTPVAYRVDHGGRWRSGGATGAFRKPAERHRALERGEQPPSMRRVSDLPGEAEARWADMRHAMRQAELRGEFPGGGGISISEEADIWIRRNKAKRGERGV